MPISDFRLSGVNAWTGFVMYSGTCKCWRSWPIGDRDQGRRAVRELLILQSELTPDAGLAAESLWKLYRAGQLDDVPLGWACQSWNLAKHPQRVIEACEATMRAGPPLASGCSPRALAIAYTAEHRDVDAHRGASRDAQPNVKSSDVTGAEPPKPVGGFF